MKRIVWAALAAVTLAGCVQPDVVVKRERTELTAKQVQDVKRAFATRLKDPGSAQYMDLRIERLTYEGGTQVNAVCGMVNAKNSFGGYNGFTMFVGRFQGSGFQLYYYPAYQCAL